MDAQAERRFDQLKKKLEALRYLQPLSFESTALVERLLNDYLKATEAFNKLKKINDELKQQVGSEQQYQEPLKQENQKIVSENSKLHLEIIKLKEILQLGNQDLNGKIRKFESEIQDMQFLSSQKDQKLQDQESQLNEMRKKLQMSFQTTQIKNSTQIQKLFSQKKDLEDLSAQFTITNPLKTAESFQQNVFTDGRTEADLQLKQQQDIWALEMRKVDERSNLLNEKNLKLEKKIELFQNQVQQLQQQVFSREQEIQRLHESYKGGQTFPIIKESQDQEKLLFDRQSMIQQLENIAGNLGVQNFQIDLKKFNIDFIGQQVNQQIKNLKSQIQNLVEDNLELKNQLEQQKSENFNESHVGKMLNQSENQNLKQKLFDLEQLCKQREQEIRVLKSQLEQKESYQSAFQSNSKAFQEKFQELENEKNQKGETIKKLQYDLQGQKDENLRMREEINLYKGRCSNLQRDIELHSNAVNKLSTDHGSMGEQIALYKNRISQLEDELTRTKEERTDQLYDIRRLNVEKSNLEETLKKLKLDQIKNQGESQSSGATVARLQAQINGQKSEYELIFNQKNELEKIIKQQKNDIIETEKKAQDYYTQLLSTKENFQILHNEQKLLSDDLTEKQRELTQVEREKLNYERELMQLRPLKYQLENFSESNRSQIEINVKNEFERNKLQKQVLELKNENERMKSDFDDVQQRYNNITVQNQKLIEQLQILEKESFEIQTRIQRGLELDKENKNNDKSIQILKDSERDLQRQIDSMKQQMTLKNQEIERSKGKIENFQNYNKTLEQETIELRKKLAELSLEIHGEQNQIIQKDHQKNQQEIEIYDLKQQIQASKKEIIQQANDLSQSQKELQDQQLKNQTLSQQVERLRSLVENLDKNKEELIKRLQYISKDKKDEQSDNAILQNDIQNYKRELMAKEQEILDLKQSIAALNSNLDEMQEEFEQKTEEINLCKQRLEKQVFEFSNMQHHVSVVVGREEDFQRRLFERENEIKNLRLENIGFRELLDQNQQIIQVKTQECFELTQDIQTLTRENKFVNTEFQKTTQANEFLKRQFEQIQDQERMAQQAVRALEMEKQDILQNYRDSCIENQRHQDTIKQISEEHNKIYQKCLDLEKQMGGSHFKIKELQQKEQNYIAEIKTLERHIDHLTHQLELAHKAMKEIQEERDRLEIEISHHKQMGFNLDSQQENLQRFCAQLEQDKCFMSQQINDLKIESSALRQQLDIDKSQINDLELLIQKERLSIHECQIASSEAQRNNKELHQELERSKQRIQSLQKHIESLQRFTGGPSINMNITNGDPSTNEELRRAQEIIEKLKEENQQSQRYIQQYENQIKELEQEVDELGKVNE